MTTRRRTAPRKPVPVTHPPLAFLDQDFLMSQEARTLRILAEYLEPAKRFEEHDVKDTIVFFGSARIKPRDEAERMLAEARAARHRVAVARQQVRMSRFYEETRELARRLTEWSKGLPGGKRFVVCTGGGPG
ncbi:MAG TPA: lysine decarboxylase, partial [Methylomirabilota bacterium]